MSVLRLVRVEGRVLHVCDLDILDQTPVFDIKPYVAYTDSVPSANAGWLEPPSEVSSDPAPTYQVEFVERACAQLLWLQPRIAFDLEVRSRAILAVGPAPHAYRRIRVFEQHSRIAIKDFRLYFRVEGRLIRVFEIETGYRARVLSDPSAVAKGDTPLSVHREFVAQFGPR
jgi:hypothetical protein